MDLSPKPWDWAEKLRSCEYAGEVVEDRYLEDRYLVPERG